MDPISISWQSNSTFFELDFISFYFPIDYHHRRLSASQGSFIMPQSIPYPSELSMGTQNNIKDSKLK